MYEECNGAEKYYFYDSNGVISGIRYFDAEGNMTMIYVVTNAQGDVIALYDKDGNAVVRYEYDAWGNIISIKNGDGTALSGDAVAWNEINPFRYRGYYYDAETELYYLQSRYYDPEVGRFLNADSVDYIGYSDSVISYNVFAYCENNAVNRLDETGTFAGFAPLIAVGKTIGVSLPVVFAGVFAILLLVYVASNGEVVLGFSEALGLLVDSFINTISSSFSSSSTKTKTKTLSDTKAKQPQGKPYQLAYVNDKNELIKLYPKYSLQEILVMLGFTNATNSIDQIYEYDNGKSSDLQRKVQPLGKEKNYWGVYTKNQSDAKALATILGVTDPPEVHGTGMYGHYNSRNKADKKSHFHIWFGAKLTY